MITREDIETVQRLLAEYAIKTQNIMSEDEFVARRLGDLPKSRARRLIVAARQNITTSDLTRKRIR